MPALIIRLGQPGKPFLKSNEPHSCLTGYEKISRLASEYLWYEFNDKLYKQFANSSWRSDVWCVCELLLRYVQPTEVIQYFCCQPQFIAVKYWAFNVNLQRFYAMEITWLLVERKGMEGGDSSSSFFSFLSVADKSTQKTYLNKSTISLTYLSPSAILQHVL